MALVISTCLAVQADIGDLDLIPRSGICSGEGSGNPLQYSCLKNYDTALNKGIINYSCFLFTLWVSVSFKDLVLY